MLQITTSLRQVGASVDVVALNQKKFRVDAPAIDTIDIDTSDYTSAAMRMWRLRVPLLVARFYSPRFESLLREKLRTTQYDIVHLEGQFLLPYVPAIRAETRAPIVLRAQNVEHAIWQHLAQQASGLRRMALRQVARSLGAWETAHLDDCDALVPIAEEDAHAFRELGAMRPMLVLPCGIEASDVDAGIDRHRVYFLGSMLYRPNREAASWLAQDVWPRVLALEPRARLTIAGSSFARTLRDELAGPGIDMATDVPDIRAFAVPFRAMLAPLFSGSGMRIKVLEAMAMGKPVIATPLGAGGVAVAPGENILIASDPDELAQLVVRCMNDDALAERIGRAARALVVERYDPDVLARHLIAFYETLLRNAS